MTIKRMTLVIATGGTALAKCYWVPLEHFMASDFGKFFWVDVWQ
jgi:hypothetical protein